MFRRSINKSEERKNVTQVIGRQDRQWREEERMEGWNEESNEEQMKGREDEINEKQVLMIEKKREKGSRSKGEEGKRN